MGSGSGKKQRLRVSAAPKSGGATLAELKSLKEMVKAYDASTKKVQDFARAKRDPLAFYGLPKNLIDDDGLVDNKIFLEKVLGDEEVLLRWNRFITAYPVGLAGTHTPAMPAKKWKEICFRELLIEGLAPKVWSLPQGSSLVLKGCVLDRPRFQRAHLTSVDLGHVRINDGTFVDTDWERCEWDHVSLETCTFHGSLFEDCRQKTVTYNECDLGDVALLMHSEFDHVSWDECKLRAFTSNDCIVRASRIRGGTWTDGRVRKTALNAALDRVRVENVVFDHNTFRKTEFSDVTFKNSDIEDCAFEDRCSASGTVLSGRGLGTKGNTVTPDCKLDFITATAVPEQPGVIKGDFKRVSF